MFLQYFNWRVILSIIAIAIISSTIAYANYLAKKIAEDERKKVTTWVEALKTKANTLDELSLGLANLITNENTEIPIIETDEKGEPSGESKNLDTLQLRNNAKYLEQQLAIFKEMHSPIELLVSSEPRIVNKYYYGQSQLLKQVKIYPIVQIIIVALFVMITLVTIAVRNKSTQNQVWAGMAKEAAHQLGTPISSLQGWIEMLKEVPNTQRYAVEMDKDVERLKLVSERFGKIGSTPQLEQENILTQVGLMVDYIKKRAPQKVVFKIVADEQQTNIAAINIPLFDWVIENLLKNALDAMDGTGQIQISIIDENNQLHIDVTDTGKGISRNHINRVFSPGFTTKQRGWGLGLSLSKRIVEQYHKGLLFVKNSELNKGTTFRITLKK